jgi:crotonobetainyl-CoA:carnitine CoA-transferase CaiB-like acyl-CoA transferase/signal transduction histidine kinase
LGTLDGIRVVDFGHYIAGPLLGMLLADQGAHVTKIDPPGGPRFRTPANATWNRGKHALALDLKGAAGLARARDLSSTADILIENFRPGVMDRLGLGARELLDAHPSLIYCSLPGFAPDDARAAMPAWEGVVSTATAVYRRSVFDARGGPPVHTAEPIASSYAAFVAAGAVAAALYARERDGRGQLVQVPLFEAMYQAIGFVGLRIERSGAGVHAVPAWDGQYRCQDGRWLHIVGTTQDRGERFVDAADLVSWREEGLIDQERLVREPDLNVELARRLVDLFATRPSQEWEDFLAEINLPAAVCRTSAEWLRHPHAASGLSGLLVPVDDPVLGATKQPGPAINIAWPPSATRADGAHAPSPAPPSNAKHQPTNLARISQDVSAKRTRLPFEGVRVLDLCIVLAGPVCARTLAEYGADVIKIDSPRRERNMYHLDINRGKRSIFLDLRTPDGLEVFWQLVDTADVIVQNFRPGVVQRLGIDYESVRKRKPGIVYGTITAYGHGGPWTARGGYEETVQALTGMQARFGGNEAPALLPYAVNDYGTGLLCAYGLALALWRRQRTGEGAHVEAALARTAGTIQSLHLIGHDSKIWDEPRGQQSRGWGPFQRLYRAADGWLFLGGGGDTPSRLARVPGLEQALRLDPATVEALLERTLPERPVDLWVDAFRAQGLGAHRAHRVSQAMADPVAQAHGLSLLREHDGHGPVRHNGPGAWLPATPPVPGRPAPLPGADAASVLAGIGRAADLDALVLPARSACPMRRNPPSDTGRAQGYHAHMTVAQTQQATGLEDLPARVAKIPRSIWRRQTSFDALSGGIRLAVLTSPFIVRWATWLIALLVVALAELPGENTTFEPYLLIGTFVQLVLLTTYVPVFRPYVLPRLRRFTDAPEQYDVLVVGLIDLALSMTAVYLSGGWRSPYFNFAITALLIPTFFLSFRGVMALSVIYVFFYLFGLAATGEGLRGSWTNTNLNSFIGAMVTPILVALVPNYLGNLLRELEEARRDAVEALSDSDLLFSVARAFLEGGRELDTTLPHVTTAVLESGRFDRVMLLVPDDLKTGAETHAYGTAVPQLPEPDELAEAFAGDAARTVALEPLPAPLRRHFEGCEWVGLVPLRTPGLVEGWLLAGAFRRPDAILHEVRLLDAIAGQVSLGIRNIRLTEQVGRLAAEGERIRMAREIHDGIAQMVYMLSLSLETAIDRVGTDPEEQRQRLTDLTALAKNALWEVRQYIFDLRPLLSGDEGLAGAIQGQVKEFQAVSDLPVDVRVTGEPHRIPLTTSAALYRIVQEGLGNIFRHAHASKVEIGLAFQDGTVSLTIADDGIGIGEQDPGGRVGYGMGNLRRRVEDLQGAVQVRSEPGAGTRIEVTVPVGGDE